MSTEKKVDTPGHCVLITASVHRKESVVGWLRIKYILYFSIFEILTIFSQDEELAGGANDVTEETSDDEERETPKRKRKHRSSENKKGREKETTKKMKKNLKKPAAENNTQTTNQSMAADKEDIVEDFQFSSDDDQRRCYVQRNIENKSVGIRTTPTRDGWMLMGRNKDTEGILEFLNLRVFLSSRYVVSGYNHTTKLRTLLNNFVDCLKVTILTFTKPTSTNFKFFCLSKIEKTGYQPDLFFRLCEVVHSLSVE